MGSNNFFKNYFQMLQRETSLPAWCYPNGKPTLQDTARYNTNNGYGFAGSDDPSDKNYATSPYINEIDAQTPSDEEEAAGGNIFKGKKVRKQGIGKYWAVIATGAGLFSDGYVNNGSGTAITMLETIYPKSVYNKSDAMANLAAIVFVGTAVGMIVFGLVADYISRKVGMLISMTILIVFSILAAGSWGIGAPEDPTGMFDMLIVMRAFVGVGIGGEYPAGSVACAEVSQKLSSGSRNRWFIWFTNYMIDSGFVASSMVAWLLTYICNVPTYPEPGNSRGLQAAWRILLGLGAIPPLSLLYLRLKFEDDDQFQKNNFKKVKTPWKLIFKRYAYRLTVVSIIWFIYDWSVYGYSTYSSMIIKSQVGTNAEGIQNIHTSFGWNVLFNMFYLPGSFLGGLSSDYFGPRITLFTGVVLQGMVGMIMAAKYYDLQKHIAGLVVAYGIFQTLGEFGPGDNLGLLCSKTCSSAIRGRYYAIAAVIGKVGAFISNYVFPAIADSYGGIDSNEGQQVLVWISASLSFVSAVLCLFLPEISQECVALEDIKFRNYLADNGYDPRQLDIDYYQEEEEIPGRV